MIIATDIIWDVDEKEDLINLPSEIIVPKSFEIEDEDAISDYLTTITGFCHKGFELVYCTYAVEVIDNTNGKFLYQIDVFDDYESAKKLAETIINNSDNGESVDDNEGVRIVRIDCRGEAEIGTEIVATFFRTILEKQFKDKPIGKEKANQLFMDIIKGVGFSLEYDTNLCGCLVYDNQLGKYRGCKEGLIVVCDAAETVEELDTYICCSFIDGMTEELKIYGLNRDDNGNIIDIPQTIGGILGIVQVWKNLPENTAERKFYRSHSEEIAMMDLLANHISEVDFDVIFS